MEITNAIFTKFIAVVGLISTRVVIAFDVAPGEITSGRARALMGAAFGLISVVIGVVVLLRSKGRLGAIIAIVLGLIGAILGVIHLANSPGGFGTGGGRLGAIVGLVLSLVGIILGGIVVVRSRSSPAE